MTTTQLRIDWDRTFAMDRISLRRARRNEERAREGIRKLQKEQDRLANVRLRARSMSGEAHTREEDFARRAENARVHLKSARRRGLPRPQWHRWEAEARHWMAEEDVSAKEVRQFEEEARRKEEEGRAVNLALRRLADEVAARAREARYLQERYAYLVRLSHRLMVKRTLTSRGTPSPLVVTNGATTVLYQILGIMKHVPGEALRLKLRPSGGITLALDFPRGSDRIIRHRGSALVLLETPLPSGLTGLSIQWKPPQVDPVAGGPWPQSAVASSRGGR